MIAKQDKPLRKSRQLDQLHRSFDDDARLNESFLVLTIGASLIATMGLVANSTAVVIGAMVVAPWMLPLRTAVFAILVEDWRLVGRSLRTLAIGAGMCLTVALTLGLGAHNKGLLVQGFFQSEIISRAEPSVLDLGIAVVAGIVATYAKLRPSAVGSMAGTAISVALVPPVCVMGLLIASRDWIHARGAGLLFGANLIGILMGGMAVLAISEPYLRQRLLRSRYSKGAVIGACAIGFWMMIPLLDGSRQLKQAIRTPLQVHLQKEERLKREQLQEDIESMIADFLTRKTITFSANLASVKLNLDQPGGNKPIDIVVYATDPRQPTYKQVEEVQRLINEKIGDPLSYNFVLSVQRVYVTQVTGKEPINVYTYQAETASLQEKLNALEEQLRSLQTSESDEDSNPN